MILDAGKANGVKPGQAVVDARGMIGRIFLAGEHTSWVILLTDLNSRIPVTIEPGTRQRDSGRRQHQGAASLETLAQGAQVKPGDQVVSSGDGGILPPGLAIGTVIADGERSSRRAARRSGIEPGCRGRRFQEPGRTAAGPDAERSACRRRRSSASCTAATAGRGAGALPPAAGGSDSARAKACRRNPPPSPFPRPPTRRPPVKIPRTISEGEPWNA